MNEIDGVTARNGGMSALKEVTEAAFGTPLVMPRARKGSVSADNPAVRLQEEPVWKFPT